MLVICNHSELISFIIQLSYVVRIPDFLIGDQLFPTILVILLFIFSISLIAFLSLTKPIPRGFPLRFRVIFPSLFHVEINNLVYRDVRSLSSSDYLCLSVPFTIFGNRLLCSFGPIQFCHLEIIALPVSSLLTIINHNKQSYPTTLT